MSSSNHPSASQPLCPACGAPLPQTAAQQMPQECPACGSHVLGFYCDLKPLGGGTMGDVYQARDTSFGNRPVAIKIPKSTGDHAKKQARFEREITATNLLNHENIVRTLTHGKLAGQPYLVMEFVTGKSLHEVIQHEFPLAESRVAQIVRGIAAGLSHADSFGVTNRDIKPENILLAAEGTPKILDFGLALIRHLDPASDRVTLDGTLLGTPSFVSPEQIRNPHDANILSDIYSLGCTAYCALSGVTPFRGSTVDVYRLHAEAPRPAVLRERPDVHRQFSELIRRMMAVSPADRPGPAAVVAELDQLIPHLSTTAPDPVSLVSPSESSFHVISSAPLHETDELEPVEGEVILDDHDDDYREVYQSAPNEAEPVEGIAFEEEPVTGEPVTGELVTGEPFDEEDITLPEDAIVNSSEFTIEEQATSATNNGRHDDTCVETLPEQAIVADTDEPPPLAAAQHEFAAGQEVPPVQPPESAATSTIPPKTRRKSSPLKLVVACGVALSICLSFWGAYLFFNTPPDPEEAWTAIQEDYVNRKWSRVEQGLASFEEEFPESPRVAEIPFFLEMARAGENVFSVNGNAEQGLSTLQKIFVDYRDTPQYDAYCADLYLALARLVERFLEQCAQTNEPARLTQASQAHELLATVSQAMTDQWAAPRTKKLKADIYQAGQALEVRRAREQALQLLKLAIDEQTTGARRDRIYQSVEKIRAQHEELTADKELDNRLDEALQSEAGRVIYVEKPSSSNSTAGGKPPADTLFVVWPGEQTATESAGQQEVFAALSQGILYVFDAQGRHLWSRRLGIDSHELPLSLKPSPTSPEALIAVSTHDNALLALSTRNGRELWRYQAGPQELLAAPLTISRWQPAPNMPEVIRGLLPTSSGEIHVLELIQGNRLGLFYTGFPMTLSGTFDPQSKLVYFPAESERVFAIDPAVIENPERASPAAKSVLLSEHASGSLRWPPVIVGQYCVMAEAYNLEQTRVRVFRLSGSSGFPDPRMAPLAERTLRGWTWFDPPATADRVTIVTDEGELGLFGLNLDNSTEALYSLIQTPEQGFPQLPIESPYRALALRNDDHRLWVAAGGELQMLSLDMFQQQVRRVWPAENVASPVTGFPLHKAQWDAAGQTLLLTTQSEQGTSAAFHAVAANSGELLWQRKLGLNLAGDPYPLPDGSLLLIDRAGRVIQATASEQPNQLPTLRQDQVEPPPASGALQIVRDSLGGIYLFLPQDDGRQFAVRNLREGLFQSQWTEIDLPAVELQGRPAVVGEHIVVPCSDGRLHRLRLDGLPNNTATEIPFPWAQQSSLAPDQLATVYSLGNERLLLLDGNQARLLEFGTRNGVATWTAQPTEFLAADQLAAHALITHEHIYLNDRHQLYRLDRDRFIPDPPQWELAGAVTSPPVELGDQIVVVEDRKRVLCFDAHPSDQQSLQPRWQSGPLAGRICGAPRRVGENMLVTDESGAVSFLNMTDGSRRTLTQLETGLIPSASAAPLAAQLFIPLVDGTLLVRQPGSRPRGTEEATSP